MANPKPTYKVDRKKILEGVEKLKAARQEKHPTYPELPDAPPIPVAEDDTVAIGLKKV